MSESTGEDYANWIKESATLVIREAPLIGMSIAEAAAEAGVSEATLYSLAGQGRLPGCRRIGKRLVIHRQTFEEWLRSGQGN